MELKNLFKEAFLGTALKDFASGITAGNVGLSALATGFGGENTGYAERAYGHSPKAAAPKANNLQELPGAITDAAGTDLENWMSGKPNQKIGSVSKLADFIVPPGGDIIGGGADEFYKTLASGEIPQTAEGIKAAFQPQWYESLPYGKHPIGEAKSRILAELGKKLEHPTRLKDYLPMVGTALGGVALMGAYDLANYIGSSANRRSVVDKLESSGHPSGAARKAYDVLQQYAPDIASNREAAFEYIDQALKFGGVATPAEIKNMVEAQKAISSSQDRGFTKFIYDMAKGVIA